MTRIVESLQSCVSPSCAACRGHAPCSGKLGQIGNPQEILSALSLRQKAMLCGLGPNKLREVRVQVSRVNADNRRKANSVC
mgnify:CR=1 FL=1